MFILPRVFLLLFVYAGVAFVPAGAPKTKRSTEESRFMSL